MDLREDPAARRRCRFAGLRVVSASIVLAGLVAACTAAGATPPLASQAASASATPAPEPSATPTPEPSETLAPSSNVTSLPSLGPVPSGTWTKINWVAGPASAGPSPTDSTSDSETSLRLFGWSRGYVDFLVSRHFGMAVNTGITGSVTAARWQGTPSIIAASSEGTLSITAASSADGLVWRDNGKVDVSGLDYNVGIEQVAEGPTGLLAVGRLEGMMCGGPSSVSALWTSADGVSWRPVDLGATFGDSTVWTIDGGSKGYIANGAAKDGTTQLVWTSDDGRAWHGGQLSKTTFKNVTIDDATAFAGGFVLSGATIGSDAGCGGPTLMTPSLWWSADGKSWIRDQVSGAVPNTSASMSVARINDRALLAIQSSWNDATQTSSTAVWTSTDGKNWAPAKDATLANLNVLTDGQNGLAMSWSPDDAGKVAMLAFDDKLNAAPLAQTGDQPTDLWANGSWTAALGPAGLVVADSAGARFWIGVPTAG